MRLLGQETPFLTKMGTLMRILLYGSAGIGPMRHAHGRVNETWEGLEAGSSEIVVPSREYRRMRAQFEASLKACFHFDSYKF